LDNKVFDTTAKFGECAKNVRDTVYETLIVLQCGQEAAKFISR